MDINQKQLFKWCLDEAHLLLCAPILEYDKGIEPFDQYWSRIVDDCTFEDAKKHESYNPILYLEEYLHNNYENNFRNCGVQQYFNKKEKDTHTYAKHIRSLIENELLQDHMEDCTSLHFCDNIISFLEKEYEAITSNCFPKHIQIIEELEKDLVNNRQLFINNNRSIVNIITNKSQKIYKYHQRLLSDYYYEKTTIIALEFKKLLIQRIIVEIKMLKNEIEIKHWSKHDNSNNSTESSSVNSFNIPRPTNNNQQLKHNNNLIIGLGGTGGRVLKEMKELSSGNLSNNCAIEFLYIDSTSEQSKDFDYQEFYNISTDIKKTSDYNGILSSKFDSGQTDSSVIWNNIKPIAEGCQWMEYWAGGQGAKQNRRAGRMMFGAHLMDIDRCLYNRIHRLYESTGISPDIDLNVFIITHLSGGTGSGSLIDMIMLIKSYHRNAQIIIIGVLPTVPPLIGYDVGRFLANAYATLMELTALNKGEFTPIDITSGVRHDRPFLGDSQKNLFSTILFNTEQIADTLYHLLTLSDSNQTLPFIKEIENQPFASLGFSKITHPLEEFERNFSYDGSAERAIWRSIYRDAECKLVVEEAEYMRLICVPYSLDERESLVNAVKFMNNILWHNPDLLIDNSKSNRDEIAMLSLCCDFRPQNLSIMPELKKQYDQLMYADKTKAISMLHIENECSELPSLLNDKNEESKLPYILLAMAMEVLCQDWDLEGNKIWAYKTIGFLPDGTPAKGTFYNRLTWLDPSHEFIYGYEMPTHLFNYIKRDVENLIEKNKDNADWIERTLKSIDAIASKIERTIGVTEAKKSKIEACDILNYGKKVIKCRLE